MCYLLQNVSEFAKRLGVRQSSAAFGRVFTCLFCSLLTFSPALAHDSPEHKVTELSFEMARSGKTPDLLMQRGIEHRAVGELNHAAADFETAFQLDPTLTV